MLVWSRHENITEGRLSTFEAGTPYFFMASPHIHIPPLGR